MPVRLPHRALLPILLTLSLLVLPGAAHALVPGDGDEVPYGSLLTGDCLLSDQKENSSAKGWFVYRLQPKRVHAPNKNMDLIPNPLPTRPEKVPATSTLQWAMPLGGENASPEECVAADYGQLMLRPVGNALEVNEAGVYWHYQVHSTVKHAWWTGPGSAPDPIPCGGNDSEYPNPANLREPPPLGPNGGWYVSNFCNTVVSHRFYVLNEEGECPAGTPDRSNWPATVYFNQYEAGIREDLPRATDNQKGGNACGPSSTMMAVLESIRHDFYGDTPEHQAEFFDKVDALGELPQVFDRVMTHTRAEQTDGGQNGANGYKIAAFLQSLGYSDAKVEGLGTGQQDIAYKNRDKIIKALNKNPVIISTAFGGARWGKSGGGHVIEISHLDVQHPQDYIVNDPAGNYFSTKNKGTWPNGHYGALSCGANVAYPMDWVESYTTGRWLVNMGKPEGSRSPIGSGLAARSGGARLTSGGAPAGQAAILLTVPVAEAPGTFYLQDAQGRRTGFVDGQPVSEIPHSWATEANDGEAGPGDEDTPDTAPAAPVRSLSVTRPAAGTTLHVADAAGGSFAIQEYAWHSGQIVAEDRVHATVGAGGAVTPAAPALDTAIAGKAPSGGGDQGGGGQGGGQNGGGSGGGTTTTPGGSTSTPGGGTTTPGGGTSTAPGRATLVKAVGARGAVKVTLMCAGAAPCKVSLQLTAKRGRKTVVVGALKTTVAGTKTVSVRLNAAGRKQLKGRAKLVVKLSARQDGKVLVRGRKVSVRAR